MTTLVPRPSVEVSSASRSGLKFALYCAELAAK